VARLAARGAQPRAGPLAPPSPRSIDQHGNNICSIRFRQRFHGCARQRGGRIAVNSADGDHAHQSVGLVRDVLLELGLSDVSVAQPHAHNYRVNVAELTGLLENAGFVDVAVFAHTVVDDVSGAEDLVRWSKSSSFGNFLNELDQAQLQRVCERLEYELQAYRTARGIQLERYLVFGVARRP
jgi:hypothetical protein